MSALSRPHLEPALFADMRTLADVVLVGARTVRDEGYGPIRLTEERSATRVARGLTAAPPLAIVSRSLDLDWQSRAFVDAAPESRTIVVTCADAPAERLAEAREVADVLVAGQEVGAVGTCSGSWQRAASSGSSARAGPACSASSSWPGTWTSCA